MLCWRLSIDTVAVVDAASSAGVAIDTIPLLPLGMTVHVGEVGTVIVRHGDPVDAVNEVAVAVGCGRWCHRLDEHHYAGRCGDLGQP